ncbi:wobble nucleotide-excising tRNase [Rhodanobacter soli]|uniref:Wobble nucleotide-excising tRNase n=1 Tax=Rhodanobacter soli TaxID=590609 RepID=A0ABV2PY96_9GAMM
MPDSLERELTDFFDESFTAAKAHLGRVVNDYGEEAVVVRIALNALMTAPVPYHDPVELEQLLDVFDARLSAAQLQMTRKVEGPSAIFEIEGVSSSLEDIRKFVTTANERIAEHNRRVANAGAEKTRLTADFWRYLIDVEFKDAAATYDRINGTVGKAVQALGAQILQSMADHARLKQELEELEQKTTGTQPTVDKINHTLRWFNFTNFHLAPADEAHTYQLIRQNGAPAHVSLSEGERTFVTFLYFYHLAQAGDSSTGVEDDRVVVLDDPISSLDSDILFIVSTLVREIADMARDGTGPIKQVLVLTHNVYFHKEITFARNGGALPKTAYWTCRKKSGWTEMVGPMDTNPVKSSYQLLWHDVRKPEGHSETLPNTMRRIFDSYFKLLGGVDVHKKSAEFEGDDCLACNALLSWANDASHAVHDDVYMAPGDIPTEVYLDVFRRVFEKLGHEGHYRMMMGDDFEEVVPETEAA